MKKLGLYLLIVSWGWGALYLLGSFAAASFNPLTWLPEGRSLVALMAGGVAAIGAIVSFSDL